MLREYHHKELKRQVASAIIESEEGEDCKILLYNG